MKKESGITFALNTGDVSFDSRASDYRRYHELTDLLPFPMLNVIGNHDVKKDGRELFGHHFGRSDFAFAYGPAYFIFYDNGSGKFDENQLTWLRKKLTEGQDYSFRIVVTHRPPFDPHFDPTQPLDFENFRARTGWWDYAETIQKIYEEYNVTMVIAGHYHYFNHTRLRGIDYLTTGGGGIIITEGEGGFHHYVVITIRDNHVGYELRVVSPPPWQKLTYYLWKDIFYELKNYFEEPPDRKAALASL